MFPNIRVCSVTPFLLPWVQLQLTCSEDQPYCKRPRES